MRACGVCVCVCVIVFLDRVAWAEQVVYILITPTSAHTCINYALLHKIL